MNLPHVWETHQEIKFGFAGGKGKYPSLDPPVDAMGSESLRIGLTCPLVDQSCARKHVGLLTYHEVNDTILGGASRMTKSFILCCNSSDVSHEPRMEEWTKSAECR